MKPYFWTILSCCILVLWGCGGGSTNPSEQVVGIYGKVLDATGKPVVGAEIVQLYGTGFGSIDTKGKKARVQGGTVREINPQEEALLCFPMPVVSASGIQYSIEEAMPISLSIIDVLTGKDVAVLADKRVVHAGNYVVLWEAIPTDGTSSSIRNGVYRIRLVKNQTVVERDVLLDTRKAAAVAITDSEGKFFISYKYFPIGFTGTRVDINGRELGTYGVSPAIQLLVRKQGVAVKEDEFIIADIQKSMDVAITIPQ